MTDYSDTLNLTYKVMVRRDAMSDNFRFNFECSACQKSECWVLVREHLSIGVDDYLNEALMIANRTHGWLRFGEGHFCPQCQPVAKVVEEANTQTEELTLRQPWEAYFFAMARQARSRSTCERAQIGGVAVTRDHEIIATAYNGAASGEPHCTDPGVGCRVVFGHCLRTHHTERNLVELLKKLWRSVANQIPGSIEMMAEDRLFRQWIQDLGISFYLVGPRDVCTACARISDDAGILDIFVESV